MPNPDLAINDNSLASRQMDDDLGLTGLPEGADADNDLTQALEAGAALVRRFEEEFDVNTLKFHGIRVWPRLRSMMTFAYTDGLFGNSAPLKERFGTLASIRRLTGISPKRAADAVAAADDLHRQAKMYYKRPVAFLGRAPRQVVMNGAVRNVLFDPLIDLAEAEEGPKFARLFIQPHPANRSKLAPGTIVAGIDPLYDWLAQLDNAHDLFMPPPQWPRRISGIDAFVGALPQELAKGLSIPAIVKDMSFIERLSIILRVYLEQAQPPAVFISGQRRINMAMTLAARQLGVPTIDIQHGASVYTRLGYKWHSWLRIPDDGYELLPNYFWVWGEQAAANINAASNPACPLHKPIVGGHPALFEQTNYTFDKFFSDRLQRAQLRVLVTLGHLSRDGLPNALVQAMEISPKTYLWLLRLHPRDASDVNALTDLRERLKAAGVENVEFTTSSAAPLTKLLGAVDWHVTPYSSSAVEASALGVPTLFVHPFGKAIYERFLELDGFYYANTAADISACLKREPPRPHSLVQTDRLAAQAILKKLAKGESPF